ncbi:O-antigen ligase family protein [Maribacter sp. 2304DJ31-5]|uniref:O-antigen ligase family protein n=1 Tax=Maribacter sp. 2304DJ31-5 TaxID=3386273 RepID=UPI0039BC73D6
MRVNVPVFLKKRFSSTTDDPTTLIIIALYILVASLNDRSLVQSTLTAKTIFFIYGLGGAMVVFVLNFFFKNTKAFVLKFSKIDLALFALFAFIIINRYLVQDNYGFSLRFIELLGLVVLYILLRSLGPKGFIWIGLAVILSGIVQAIYGNLQLFGYYPSLHSGFNISGSYFNPGPYAGFLASVWPMALGMYLFKDKIRAVVFPLKIKSGVLMKKSILALFEYIPLIGMASIAIVLPATRSRAAWLAVLVSSALLLMVRYGILKKFRSFGWKKRGGIVMVSCLIIGISLYGLYHFKKGSADGRVLIWKVSTNIVKENLIFGVGLDRFKAYYMDAQADYFSRKEETKEAWVADNSYYAFNEPLQFLMENGLIGILITGMLFWSIIQSVALRYVFFKILAFALLTSIGIFGLFAYPAQILPIKMIGVLALAVIAHIDKDKINVSRPIENQKMLMVKAIVLLGAMALIWTGYSRIKMMGEAHRTWKNALETYNYGLYEDSIEEFEKAWPTLKNQGDFLMNYGKALAMAGKNERAIEILEKAKKHLNTTIIETTLGDSYKAIGSYKKTEKAYQRAAKMVPHRFYPQYLLAKLYEESGQRTNAMKKAEELLKKEVKVPSRAIEEIQMEMRKILENPTNSN